MRLTWHTQRHQPSQIYVSISSSLALSTIEHSVALCQTTTHRPKEGREDLQKAIGEGSGRLVGMCVWWMQKNKKRKPTPLSGFSPSMQCRGSAEGMQNKIKPGNARAANKAARPANRPSQHPTEFKNAQAYCCS